ncbi:hypothetical protein [Pseudolactococcus carnosus]|uniref:hypothetical protein n=1 Tax=Pseudolactococcus carnosus TaxID=2749961 RepID=UPI001FBB06FE|nr:hypothetical protein [Lactococcus carnosus]MCJ2002782.1 hypothetical protein [Lactococcus carnosus]
MVQRKTPFDIFLTKDYTVVTKDEQIAYLKQHEVEMTDHGHIKVWHYLTLNLK